MSTPRGVFQNGQGRFSSRSTGKAIRFAFPQTRYTHGPINLCPYTPAHTRLWMSFGGQNRRLLWQFAGSWQTPLSDEEEWGLGGDSLWRDFVTPTASGGERRRKKNRFHAGKVRFRSVHGGSF